VENKGWKMSFDLKVSFEIVEMVNK